MTSSNTPTQAEEIDVVHQREFVEFRNETRSFFNTLMEKLESGLSRLADRDDEDRKHTDRQYNELLMTVSKARETNWPMVVGILGLIIAGVSSVVVLNQQLSQNATNVQHVVDYIERDIERNDRDRDGEFRMVDYDRLVQPIGKELEDLKGVVNGIRDNRHTKAEGLLQDSQIDDLYQRVSKAEALVKYLIDARVEGESNRVKP